LVKMVVHHRDASGESYLLGGIVWVLAGERG